MKNVVAGRSTLLLRAEARPYAGGNEGCRAHPLQEWGGQSRGATSSSSVCPTAPRDARLRAEGRSSSPWSVALRKRAHSREQASVPKSSPTGRSGSRRGTTSLLNGLGTHHTISYTFTVVGFISGGGPMLPIGVDKYVCIRLIFATLSAPKVGLSCGRGPNCGVICLTAVTPPYHASSRGLSPALPPPPCDSVKSKTR